MTKPFQPADILAGHAGAEPDLLQKLMQIAAMIEIDSRTGRMSIRNGKASIELHADGTIRLRGTRIVQTSEKDITLDAAWIDLN